MPELQNLSRDQRKAILDMLREARGTLHRDSESLDEAVSCLEHIGQILVGELRVGLSRYRDEILELANSAPLVHRTRIEHLFDTVRRARNDAVHGGSYIRHHAKKLIELILILEEAIMLETYEACDLMVSSPVAAELWQNVATVRRTMLANAFSYLPVRTPSGDWKLVADHAIVEYLSGAESNNARNRLLGVQLGEAVDSLKLKLIAPKTCEPSTNRSELIGNASVEPCLVIEQAGDQAQLVGILTAFDLL